MREQIGRGGRSIMGTISDMETTHARIVVDLPTTKQLATTMA